MNNTAQVVIDVPESISPEQAAQLLNTPGEGYFLVSVLPIAGGHRAYLRRYKQTPPHKSAPEPAQSMKKKHIALVCLGILGVCLSMAYAAIILSMAQAFGFASWSNVYRDILLCTVIVGLGVCEIYLGLKHRKTSGHSSQTQV